MTTDDFAEAARAEAERYFADPGVDPLTLSVIDHAMHMAEWARTHLAAQRAEEVCAWAVQQYPSGTPLDQDRRMVAAETEAYLSGRTEREMSDLAQAAKHAGPVDPPAQEPTDAEVEAAKAVLDSVEYADEPQSIRAALSAARAARRDEKGKP